MPIGCIAGAWRRQQEDFGYAYICGPRSAEEQDAFFAAELKTQSLERAFAAALGLEFRPSADNLNADVDAFSATLEDYEKLIERLADNHRWPACQTVSAAPEHTQNCVI